MMTDEPINVVALRGELGWTQQQLAEHCGVDRSTVSTWEQKPPTKGPALILLRQLSARVESERTANAVDEHQIVEAAE